MTFEEITKKHLGKELKRKNKKLARVAKELESITESSDFLETFENLKLFKLSTKSLLRIQRDLRKLYKDVADSSWDLRDKDELDGIGKHSCPKAAELGDNHDEEYCNCCSDCTENCAMEI